MAPLNDSTDLAGLSIDLHSHTLASDGRLSLQQLLDRAGEQSVDILAVTDHDTTAGLAENYTVPAGLQLLHGVEISCDWQGKELHIVGLGIDIHCAALQEKLQNQVRKRREKALKIAEKLARAQVDGGLELVASFSEEQVICRTHFMRFLLEKGVVPDGNRAFKRYLGRNGKAYVKSEWMPLQDAITAIRDAGGCAVLAHPTRYGFSNTKLSALLADFRQAGGVGIELVYPSLTPDKKRELQRMAEKYDLYGSLGSDFHDPETPWTELGRLGKLPEACPAIWQLPEVHQHLQLSSLGR